MDFMKVFDQTVREIKREVNLKVLKVPEIEQKVLDATEDEPWGPHGTALADIAQATKKFTECQIVMNVLWTRLAEIGKNWRFVYKALAVIEYLVAHGSEHAVDDITEHTFQISSLASFEYVEPNGKDLGINVRKKAETIVGLLNNKDKIQEVRSKAAENREKYVGLSSSGITYKSGAASFGSGGYKKNDPYDGFGNTKYGDSVKESYKDNNRYGEDKYEKPNKLRKETSSNSSFPVQSSGSPLDEYEEDDFDPRGTSGARPPVGSKEVDFFGQNFVADLLDAPITVPSEDSRVENDPSAVDLFADAGFISATIQPEVRKSVVPQTSVDLFISQGSSSPAPNVSSRMDFFAEPGPVIQLDNISSVPATTSNALDPFAAISINSFSESEPFGAFHSHTDPLSIGSNQNSSKDRSPGNINNYSLETKPSAKKDAFQVKSGIWADSLSRGIIDLNITAPKKVNLADVGIVGGLPGGSEDKLLLSSYFMGQAKGVGPAIGKYELPSSSVCDDDLFSSQKYEFKSYHK